MPCSSPSRSRPAVSVRDHHDYSLEDVRHSVDEIRQIRDDVISMLVIMRQSDLSVGTASTDLSTGTDLSGTGCNTCPPARPAHKGELVKRDVSTSDDTRG